MLPLQIQRQNSKDGKNEVSFYQTENQQVIENAMNSSNPHAVHQRNQKDYWDSTIIHIQRK